MPLTMCLLIPPQCLLEIRHGLGPCALSLKESSQVREGTQGAYVLGTQLWVRAAPFDRLLVKSLCLLEVPLVVEKRRQVVGGRQGLGTLRSAQALEAVQSRTVQGLGLFQLPLCLQQVSEARRSCEGCRVAWPELTLAGLQRATQASLKAVLSSFQEETIGSPSYEPTGGTHNLPRRDWISCLRRKKKLLRNNDGKAAAQSWCFQTIASCAQRRRLACNYRNPGDLVARLFLHRCPDVRVEER
mmetsp:Transcript_88538/g.185037  ORF Transcript_88538/g.185037 Transcript_88538/m.185037 type:complete len:243 (-) Transcript_88538:571-1299(-)